MFLLALFALATPEAFAYDSGVTGRSTSGCGSCHGSSASSSTTVAFSTSSTTVAPGDTITVYLSVTNSSQKAAGLNVSASSGTLAKGTNTALSKSEITHSTATSMTSGVTTFDFEWTAPTTEGSVTLYGAGNAVNDNGSSSGDGWNTTTATITVDDGCDDDDKDGYDAASCGGDDCDDTNAKVSPAATEVCNDVDDDCDGTADDSAADAGTWYTDSDADGYGTGRGTTSCDQPAKTAEVGGDCDDSEGDTYPGATDAWYDGVDSDCGGEDDYDADKDGYDVLSDDDCDDTNKAINPGKTEAWYDGVDADCSGGSDIAIN